jgi:hypothetical protein
MHWGEITGTKYTECREMKRAQGCFAFRRLRPSTKLLVTVCGGLLLLLHSQERRRLLPFTSTTTAAGTTSSDKGNANAALLSLLRREANPAAAAAAASPSRTAEPSLLHANSTPTVTATREQQQTTTQEQRRRGGDDPFGYKSLQRDMGSTNGQRPIMPQRTWPKRSYEEWCSSSSIDSNRTDGTAAGAAASAGGGSLVLVKVPKSASSTVAGIVLRIHDNHHRQGCTVQYEHSTASELLQQQAMMSSSASPLSPQSNSAPRSFWMAPIRIPESRALSSVYFHHISFHAAAARTNAAAGDGTGAVPRDGYVIRYLNATPSNSIANYVAPCSSSVGSTARTDAEVVAAILEFYDFLLVVDRMDESVAVFSLLTGVPLASLLYLSSTKQAGSWYYTNHRCIALKPAAYTDAIYAYFASDAWRASQNVDRLLYVAANKSLDATIDHFGRSTVFANHLRTYRRLQGQIRDVCSSRNSSSITETTHFPCSPDGVPQLDLAQQSCYRKDFGCGYPCIDRVVQGLG